MKLLVSKYKKNIFLSKNKFAEFSFISGEVGIYCLVLP